MRDESQFDPGMRRALWVLREYLPHIVVIGGWVPYLYRQFGGFATWHSALSRTSEVDILLDLAPSAEARRPIVALLREAGFRPTDTRGYAAIWENDAATGERIEFLVPHAGTARQLGRVRAVTSQAGLGAISLTDMDLLSGHTTTLDVPIPREGGTVASLSVRVPLLGAYIATKAATFAKRAPVRGAHGAWMNPKAAKDLLYVRDVMAAGKEVVDHVEEQLRRMRRGAVRARRYIDGSANHVDDLLRNDSGEKLDEVARMLAERDGMDAAMARVDVAGHLTDYVELLREM